MNKHFSLSHFSDYSEGRLSSSFVAIEDFVTTDNLLPNKGGITISSVSPKGTLVSYKKGDILIGNIRPYLKKIWFANRDGGCSQDVLVIRPKDGVNKQFLYYALHRDDFFIHIMNGKKGTKMPRGDKDHVMTFLVPDFRLPVQNRIAEALSSFDIKIELNKKINTELEAVAKMLYDYWFVQFEFPNQHGKPYKSSGGRMDWNTELKKVIPVGWEVKSLFDIAEFINGLACQKYRPVGSNEDFLPVIKIKEMSEGLSVNTERVRVDIPEKNIVEDGDVLFSWSATLDIKIWSQGKGGLNQHIFKVTSDLYPKSFYYFEILNYLQHFKMMAELRKTTMGHITKDHLTESRISVPPLPLIKSLDQKLNPILQQILSNNKQNQELSNLRDWLLPMLMNGQLTVGGAYEQMEEALSMAAEPEVAYSKVVKLNIPKKETGFAKQVLAGKIVSLFKEDKNFTHIKFQKLQFLAEHIAEADVNLNYYFQTAGPYDNRFMHTIAHSFKKSKWFDEQKYKFIPLEKGEQIEGYYQGYFGAASHQLNKLFHLLENATDVETEIIATLYAVWNNRVLLKQSIEENLLIQDFYSWSNRKHRYSEEQIHEGLHWLKQNNFEPRGFGKEIKQANKKAKQI